MVIKMKEVREMFNKMMDAYEDGYPELEIKENLYWVFDNRYDPAGNKKENILLGSLEDDQELMLQPLIKDPDYWTSPTNFDKIGNILIAISDELSK